MFGWIATGLTLVYRVPQIYKLVRTKSGGDLSSYSYGVQSTAYLFYILHGITIGDPPILTMGSIALCQNLVIVGLRYHYAKFPNNQSEVQPNSE